MTSNEVIFVLSISLDVPIDESFLAFPQFAPAGGAGGNGGIYGYSRDEGVFANGGNTARNVNRAQGTTHKGAVADLGKAVRQMYVGQVGAYVEDVVADLLDPFFKHDRFQSAAAREGVIPNRAKGGGEMETLKAAASDKCRKVNAA